MVYSYGKQILLIGVLLMSLFSRYQLQASPLQKEIINMKNKPQIIIFLAPPGAGKGTISQQASDELNFNVISTGNLCRQYKEQDSDLGRELRMYLDKGQLVPDNLVNRMVENWLKNNTDGTPIILDGYPRTETQAASLAELLPRVAPRYKLTIIELSISDQKLIQRLSNRMLCSNKSCQKTFTVSNADEEHHCDTCNSPLFRRADDALEVVIRRINGYHEIINPLKDFYHKKNQPIITLDVNDKTPQEVFALFREHAK